MARQGKPAHERRVHRFFDFLYLAMQQADLLVDGGDVFLLHLFRGQLADLHFQIIQREVEQLVVQASFQFLHVYLERYFQPALSKAREKHTDLGIEKHVLAFHLGQQFFPALRDEIQFLSASRDDALAEIEQLLFFQVLEYGVDARIGFEELLGIAKLRLDAFFQLVTVNLGVSDVQNRQDDEMRKSPVHFLEILGNLVLNR